MNSLVEAEEEEIEVKHVSACTVYHSMPWRYRAGAAAARAVNNLRGRATRARSSALALVPALLTALLLTWHQ